MDKNIYELVVEITFRTKLVASPTSTLAEYGKYISETPEVDDDVDVNQPNKFMRNDDGNPVLKDYQWRGFIKSHSDKRYKRDIDEFVCIKERWVTLELEANTNVETIEQRIYGRISNVHTEVAPAGSHCRVTFLCCGKAVVDIVKKALSNGDEGFGYMRSEGYGKFSYEIVELKKLDK